MPRKTTTTQVEPTNARKAALAGAATEVLPGNKHGGDPPRQAWGDLRATSKSQAREAYKEAAADFAEKAQTWADAKELQEVRADDLVRVFHRPNDDHDEALRVARATAKAIESCKVALEEKQQAKKALDAAWAAKRSFEPDLSPEPLIPADNDTE